MPAGIVNISDAVKRQVVRSIGFPNSFPRYIASSAMGDLTAVSGDRLALFDARDYELVWTFNEACLGVIFSQDGKRLYASTRRGLAVFEITGF